MKRNHINIGVMVFSIFAIAEQITVS